MTFVQRETVVGTPKEVDLDASDEKIKSLVLEYLKKNDSGKFKKIYEHLKNKIKPDTAGDGFDIPRMNQELINDIMWDLVVKNIVRPGAWDAINLKYEHNFPFFHVSENGKKVLANLS